MRPNTTPYSAPACRALALLITGLAAGPASALWINEIHYDNIGGDTGEFVEVAGAAGTDLTGWAIEFYTTSGTVYSTLNLMGTLGNDSNGFGFASFAESGIQNGPADGLALISSGGDLVSFLSYEGTLTGGTGTRADGLTSTDIGVSESGSTTIGFSLQLAGAGSSVEDFTWSGPMAETPGAVNTGQRFLAVPDGGASLPLLGMAVMAVATAARGRRKKK